MTSYLFSEDVGVQEICAIVYEPTGNCPIDFAFVVDLETNIGTAGNVDMHESG